MTVLIFKFSEAYESPTIGRVSFPFLRLLLRVLAPTMHHVS
jgi:hypothetical protein